MVMLRGGVGGGGWGGGRVVGLIVNLQHGILAIIVPFLNPLPPILNYCTTCTASPVSGRLLLGSSGTIGFRDVTEIIWDLNDRAHGERKRPASVSTRFFPHKNQ